MIIRKIPVLWLFDHFCGAVKLIEMMRFTYCIAGIRPIRKLKRLTAIAVDARNQTVYFSDARNFTIYKRQVYATDIETVVDNGSSR